MTETDAVLNPPARFSHGLLLVLTVALAALLSSATGQRTSLLVGSTTAALLFGGFWAFTKQGWLHTTVGTIAVQIATIGLLLTAVWVFRQALAATSAWGFLLNVAVAVSLIGGVVSIVGYLLPQRVTRQDGPAIIALLYGGALAIVVVIGVAFVRLGLTSLFGMSTSAFIEFSGALALDLMTANPVAQAGSLAILIGWNLWYAVRLSRLPLGRRFRYRIALRWHQTRKVPPRTRNPTGQSDEGQSGGNSSELELSPSESTTVSDVLGLESRWQGRVRKLGIAVAFLGLGAFILGLAPSMQDAATNHPMAETLGSFLGRSAAPHRLLGGVALGLSGARLGHSLIWRGIHVNWSVYGRRIGYVGGSIIVLFGAGLLGGPVVNTLLSTPTLQIVPMGVAGPVVTPTDAGLRFAESGLTRFELQQRPQLFEPWFRGILKLIGRPIIGIGLYAVMICVGTFLLVVTTLGAASARFTRPGPGIGLLFFGATGSSVIVPQGVLPLAAGAGVLLVWEIYSYGQSLALQVDPRASTLTAEVVHLGMAAAVVGFGFVVTVLAIQVASSVPVPDNQWQVLAALSATLFALILGLSYLGLNAE